MSGKALARHGSSATLSPSLKRRMCSWQTVVPRIRPVRDAVDQEPAGAADALAAVRVERDRILALRDQPLVDDVEHLEERHVGRDVLGDVVHELPGRVRARLPPDFQENSHAADQLQR